MTSSHALLAFLLAVFCVQAPAEILFEAFYRIEKSGRHTGYMVQRLSRNNGQKTLSTYIRTRRGDREYYVTSKSVAGEKSGASVETVHISNTTGAPFRIAAKFNKGKGTVSFYSNNARKPGLVNHFEVSPYPSAFLFYTADLPQFQIGKKYAYTAFYEENGRTQVGLLSLLGSRENAGVKVLQILNDDSGQPLENFVGLNGEPLGSRSISTGVTVYWVSSKDEAVGNLTYPTGEMTMLFGDLPQGKKNSWSQASNFHAKPVIESFPVWNGLRSISSENSGRVLPLPKKGSTK